MTDVRIIPPTPDLQESWLAARAEFAGDRLHGSGAWHATGDLADPAVFAGWVDFLLRQEDPREQIDPPLVPASYRWLVRGGEYAGCFTLRHRLTEELLSSGGHIGYSVRPSARRHGYATLMARAALRLAAGMGIEEALITADETNLPSQRTILAVGGRYQDTREGLRRYWVRTAGA